MPIRFEASLAVSPASGRHSTRVAGASDGRPDTDAR